MDLHPLRITENYQPLAIVLTDLTPLGAVALDGQFIVGTGAGTFNYESGNTARTSLALGSGSNVQFASLALFSASNQLRIIDTDDGQEWRIGANSDLFLIEDEVTGKIPFRIADGAENLAVVIDVNGYVGLGLAAPSMQLDMVGSLNLEATISSSTGVIHKGGISFLHDFQHPTALGGGVTGQNLFIGRNAGNFHMGGTADNTWESSRNVGIGRDTLKENTKGFSNVAIGVNALTANTEGKQNFGMGYSAVQRNTIGSSNIGIGALVLQYNINGDKNVAIGSSAGRGSVGNSHSNNTFIGYQAGRSVTTGSSNIFIGNDSGHRQTTNGNLLILDNQIRMDVTTELTNAIIHGTMDAVPANQILRVNAELQVIGRGGFGTTTPNAPLEVKGLKPGIVGGHQSGMLHVTDSDPAEFSNSVITGHNAFNGNTQLWYLGNTSSLNNDIAFINRQNAALH
ncbi:hypothetical protein LCGC14_2401740, partial [marine sediment metagenome]